MGRTRHRPRRGEPGPDILVEGDDGAYAGPQGGARKLKQAFMESGDLDSREFGVPEADLPGGIRHFVNDETRAAKTAAPPERPADYHKYHGVPSDNGEYETPDPEITRAARPVPVPKLSDAVPVYQVERPDSVRSIRSLFTEGPVVIATGTVDPVRIADRDPDRVTFWICNETTASGTGASGPGVRIGDWETTGDGRGLLIPANTIKDFDTQDSLYLINTSGSAITVSWGYITEIPAAGT
jgi:hypothetical protein